MGFSFFQMFDPLYWMIVLPALLLAGWAQMKVKSSFARYSKVRNHSGATGARAAFEILRNAGIVDVQIELVRGWLSDHYDPRKKVLRLSPDVYNGETIAAVGVAAHEAGHAIQHARKYAPLSLRSALVPTASIGSTLAFPLIILGWGLATFTSISPALALGITKVGFWLFAAVVVFQIINLPVEFNASSRAKKLLTETGIIRTQEEARGVSSVLNAAAMTYVAATIAALANLLYYAIRLGLLGGGDD